jgi:hypothetical protein
MKNALAGLAMALACFGCAPLGATTAPHATTEPQAAMVPAAAISGITADEAAAMAGLYQHLCLQSFPAAAALAAALRPLDASELAAPEVARYLHADPGRAWRLRVGGVRYILTVEDPPFHTCALRRMTAAGLPDDSAYAAVVGAYARAHGLAIKPLPKQVLPLSGNADLTAFSIILAPPGARTARETSLLLLTRYHRHLDREKWPRSADGPGIEVRMAHQIVQPFRIDTVP